MAELKKTIGKRTLMFLIINAILGTGIFFSPSIGASIAGPSSLISWSIMAVVAIFISAYFAELISMFPKSGGVYEYVKQAFGEFPSFIIGWVSWIVANITIAMLIVGSIYYLLPGMSMINNIAISLAIILIFNTFNYRGIEQSSKLLLVFGLMTISILIAIIFPGFFHINPDNFFPFFSTSPLLTLLAIYFISETFFGWESATYLTEEVKDAKNTVPRYLVAATAIISVISILFVVVTFGVMHWQTLQDSCSAAPYTCLASEIFGSYGSLFAVLIFIPLIGTAASWIIASPRLLYAMARDKVLPASFMKIHEKYRTPTRAIIFQAIVTSLITIVGIGNYEVLLSLLIPLVLIVYSFVMLSLVKLRISKPHLERSFKAPFGKTGPILIVIFNIALLSIWLTQVSGAFSVFSLGLLLLVFGVPMYLLIKLETDIKFTEKFFDSISWFWNLSFQLWYTKEDVESVIRKIKPKKGMTVLDFGCGTGITTLELAKRLKEKGTIIALDMSKKQLEKAFTKIEKAMKISNVVFIKESHLVPFKKNSFDAIVSVGTLGHLNNPKEALEKIFYFLKPGGSFSFMAFGRALGIPSQEFLSEKEQIKQLFSVYDPKVKIKKDYKKFSEYWYIWGTKKK